MGETIKFIEKNDSFPFEKLFQNAWSFLSGLMSRCLRHMRMYCLSQYSFISRISCVQGIRGVTGWALCAGRGAGGAEGLNPRLWAPAQHRPSASQPQHAHLSAASTWWGSERAAVVAARRAKKISISALQYRLLALLSSVWKPFHGLNSTDNL